MDIAKRISDVLEFPAETMMDIPKITMIGNQKILVENYNSLLDYKKEIIRLKYSSGVIEISGKNFEIKSIGEENIEISGETQAVRLI